MLTIGIEWTFREREFEEHWRDEGGNLLPVLPIGSEIQIEKNDEFEKWSFALQVVKIRARCKVGSHSYVGMICNVIEGHYDS